MKTSNWMMTCLLLIAAGCSSGEDETVLPVTPQEPSTDQIPISLNCGVSTRATDYGFENKDCIGLYVVNYDENTPGTLQLIGNHVDNMKFTYDGVWTPDKEIFWKDATTKADFYAYYPYAILTTVTAHPFKLKADQSTEAAYKASEFLWGKTGNVAPTEEAISILTHHVFSCALIKVKAGNGFTQESLNAANVSVKMNQIKTEATVNLLNGTATAKGEAGTVIPCKEGDNYKALIAPQTVEADNLITVTVDGRDFNLKKEFTFVGGKRHSIPVTVSKTSNGINVGIGSWEDDDTDNGGTAE